MLHSCRVRCRRTIMPRQGLQSLFGLRSQLHRITGQHSVAETVSDRLAFKQVPYTCLCSSTKKWRRPPAHLDLATWLASPPFHSQPIFSCRRETRFLEVIVPWGVHLRRFADEIRKVKLCTQRLVCPVASRLTHHASRASCRSTFRDLTSTTPPKHLTLACSFVTNWVFASVFLWDPL